MLKRILASTVLRKGLVFFTVFALTGVWLGTMMMGFSESESDQPVMMFYALPEDEGEDVAKDDFARLVRWANGTSAADEELLVLLWEESEEEEEDVEIEAEEDEPFYLSDISLSKELQEFTYERCQELDLEYELVLALMWRESRFNVDAVGYNANGTKDNGIMQINDVNKGWLRDEHGITDLMDPYQNILAGTAMLAEYMDTYDDENAALMAYHYGKAGMKQKVAQGITTNRHVSTALSQRDNYRKLLQETH